MNTFYREVAERAAHRCEYCYAPKIIFSLLFEGNHIRPLAAGGATEASNLALSRRACNSYKGSRQASLDPQTQQIVPLFHPRCEDWNIHFEIAAEANEIIGKSPTGRATVHLLQINSDA